jgi:hypothetical protein
MQSSRRLFRGPVVALALAAAPAACGTRDEPAKPIVPATHYMDSVDKQIDVPSNWIFEKRSDDEYVFTAPDGTLTVTRAMQGAANVERAASDCAGTVVEKKTIHTRTFYYVCDDIVDGKTVRRFDYIHLGNDALYSCAGTAPDVAPMLAACETLKKDQRIK